MRDEPALNGPADLGWNPQSTMRHAHTFPIPPAAPVAECRSCGGAIVWITMAVSGRRMPVEASGEKRGESHFAHCPQASEHRRSR